MVALEGKIEVMKTFFPITEMEQPNFWNAVKEKVETGKISPENEVSDSPNKAYCYHLDDGCSKHITCLNSEIKSISGLVDVIAKTIVETPDEVFENYINAIAILSKV